MNKEEEIINNIIKKINYNVIKKIIKKELNKK